MAAYCLDDTKKINKSQMAIITGKFRELGSIVGDLLIRNARLEGRLLELQEKKVAGQPPRDGTAGGIAIASTSSTEEKKMWKNRKRRTSSLVQHPPPRTLRRSPGRFLHHR